LAKLLASFPVGDNLLLDREHLWLRRVLIYIGMIFQYPEQRQHPGLRGRFHTEGDGS
jgi:hypothetical protein